MSPIHLKYLPAITLLFFGLFFGSVMRAQGGLPYNHTEDVVYGRKFGMALTLDILEPLNKNGAAVFWVVSGGYFSNHADINPAIFRPWIERGYTVFAVVHGSQPRFDVPEIIEDVHRAVRFVRHNAERWNVAPNKFAISGSSAGGHLALTIGTQGAPGNPDAEDPIDRESSAVQAVACFFPPTDMLNWSKPNQDWMQFKATRQFAAAFGHKPMNRKVRRELGLKISPINFVTTSTAPTLIIHGTEDKLVPIYQSQQFGQTCTKLGVPFRLVIKLGEDHGYRGWEEDISVFADWFDEHVIEAAADER